MIQRTVVLIKPDGVVKHIIGKVIDRFESKGLVVKALKMVRLTQPVLDQWYAHHADKPFFADLSRFMMETPVVAFVLEGEDAVKKAFDICGPTDPKEAAPGTIRRDFAESKQKNIVHRSDSPEAAAREMGLIFTAAELS